MTSCWARRSLWNCTFHRPHPSDDGSPPPDVYRLCLAPLESPARADPADPADPADRGHGDLGLPGRAARRADHGLPDRHADHGRSVDHGLHFGHPPRDPGP